jgi:chromosome segregation ATPase
LALLKAAHSKSDSQSADLTQLKKGVTVLLEYSPESAGTFNTQWSALKGPSIEAIHPTRLQVEGLHATIADSNKRYAALQKQMEDERKAMLDDFDEKMRKLRELHEKELSALRKDGTGSSAAWEAERQKLKARITSLEAELSNSNSINSRLTSDLSTANSRMEQQDKIRHDLEAQMAELRSQISIVQRSIIEIEDKSRSELMISSEETRKAIVDGERNTAEKDMVREAAESELAKVRGLLAGAEKEIASLRDRLSEQNSNYASELAKAQAAFDAALALARREGIEKSELQAEISRLRAELADLTKTMEHRVSIAESRQRDSAEAESRSAAALAELERVLREAKEELAAVRQRSENDLRSMREEKEQLLHSNGRLQEDLAAAGRLAEKTAAENAEQMDHLEDKCRIVKSELSTAVIEQQTLNSKVNALESTISGLNSENARLRQELSSSGDALDRCNSKVRSLEQQLADMEDEMTRLRDLLDASARNLAAETEKLTAARNEATSLHSDKLRLASEIDELKSKLDASQRLAGQLEGQLATVKNELSSKNSEFMSLDNEMCTMRKRLNDELDTEKMKCSSLTDKCVRLEEQNTELNQLLEDLKSQLAQKDSELQKALRDYRALQQELESFRSKYNQEIAALQAALDRKSSEVNALKADYKKLQDELAEARKLINKLREDLDTMRMNFERQLAEAEARYNALQTKNGESAEAQERQISLLEAQIQALKAELAQANDVEKDLRRQLEELSRMLNESKANYTDLNSRFMTIEGHYKELGLRMVSIRRQKAYNCFREFIRIARMGNYSSIFYFWKSFAQDGAIQRGADELHRIVDDASSGREPGDYKSETEPWDINAIDVAAIAGEFGL